MKVELNHCVVCCAFGVSFHVILWPVWQMGVAGGVSAPKHTTWTLVRGAA